jgi:hypothetical protein
VINESIYRGDVYRRYPKSRHASQRRYFRRYAPTGVIMLHRQVWTDARGIIPKGFEVHHRDRDFSRNVLSNLRLVESRRHHAAEKLSRIKRYAGKGTYGMRIRRWRRRLTKRGAAWIK